MQQVHHPLGAHNVVLEVRLPQEDLVVDALGHYQVAHPPHTVHIVEVHLHMHVAIIGRQSVQGLQTSWL